jgi:hypothetical protein
MHDLAEQLTTALVAAYRPYLEVVSAAHAIDDAIAEGESWLEEALTALADSPFVSQRRGPLELFQEALRFPTEALVAAGVAPPPRSPHAAAALPGDVYGLAPASSQDLGEEAWRAHLAWGAAKAAALTTVGWFGRDLADRSKIESAATGLGLRFRVAPDLGACRIVIVDLTLDGAAAVIEQAGGGDWTAVAYGPHGDKARLEAARSKGAVAVARSRFFADPGLFLVEQPGEAEGLQ